MALELSGLCEHRESHLWRKRKEQGNEHIAPAQKDDVFVLLQLAGQRMHGKD